MVSILTQWRPYFGYVSNDLDPHFKVTEVKIWNLFGGAFCGRDI